MDGSFASSGVSFFSFFGRPGPFGLGGAGSSTASGTTSSFLLFFLDLRKVGCVEGSLQISSANTVLPLVRKCTYS